MVVIDTFPCGICQKKIPAHGKSVYCNHYKFWVHMRCNNISNSEYEELQEEPDDVPWFCLKCKFPFGSLGDEELSNLNEFDYPSFIDSI